MQDILKTLIENPTEFNPKHAQEAMNAILQGQSTAAQTAAFLTALKLNQLDQHAEVVHAIAATMREYALQIDSSRDSRVLVDIVGTGGDGQDTFNVSTAAGIVAAGAGCAVAKHGNRASSSACGSGDVLEALGAQISAFTPDRFHGLFQTSEDKGTFGFLFSQTYHPAMKHVAAIRKELKFKTVFNILGPMLNPAQPKRIIVGVAKKSVGPLMAQALMMSGVEYAWVVHGELGLDEIAPEGKTSVWTIKNQEYDFMSISPSDFGLAEHPLKSVVGGDAQHNANIMRQLLKGELKEGPILDFVLLNAAALLFVAQKASSLKEAVQIARESIFSGKAHDALEAYVAATH